MSIAEKFEVIADAVYEKGIADQKAVSVDWDVIQNKGNRNYWINAFAYWGVSDINPKYMIKPTARATQGVQSMFQGSYVENVDWSKFDFSETTTFYTTFNNCPYLVSVDADLTPTSPNANVWGYFCSGAQKLTRIQKMVTQLTHAFTSSFNKCYELADIRFAPYDADNGIGIGNDISFADSPNLTRESIISILEALAYDINTDGSTYKTLTFSTDLGFERKLKDCILGDDDGENVAGNFIPAESGSINGVTYEKSKLAIELYGTTTAETRINLFNTPIVFPESLSDRVKEMSLQGVSYLDDPEYGYLRATIQRTDGTTEECYLSGYSSGYFYQGDIITSIDLVIPEGVTFNGTVYAVRVYIDYIYWLEEVLHYPWSWNIVY